MRALAESLFDAADRVHECPRCCTITASTQECDLCADLRRDDSLLIVVATIQDQAAIESTAEYRGRYHILHGTLSPLAGIGPDQLRMRQLLARLSGSDWRLSKGEHDALVSGEKDAWVLAREKAGEPDRGLMKTFANLIGERAVSAIGSFSNVRTRVLAAGFVFEIDHSRFPDESSGCEVEIEVPASMSDAEETLSAFFDEAGVKTQKASSKAKRFFDAIKGRA